MAVKCTSCGRPLTHPDSVARRMGPVCSGKGYTTQRSGRKEGLTKLDLSVEDTFLALDMREHGLQLIRSVSGAVCYNTPHYCVHHSPTGYNFGYAGSGPSDLALNTVEHLLHLMGYKGKRITDLFDGSCFRAAWKLHQLFKDKFIATISRKEGGCVPYQDMVDWIQGHQQVLDECALEVPRKERSD